MGSNSIRWCRAPLLGAVFFCELSDCNAVCLFEGIRKLVMEVFQNMWFTPVREKPSLDSTALIRKVMNITDVVATSKEMGLEWFEQLLVSVSSSLIRRPIKDALSNRNSISPKLDVNSPK